ncbi:MAG: site-specific DNA-methyltransferase, partial [Planctomycetaceae bacterium]|nr:site-specific DNA-methyltransferase [Planctomycetaceae bacterium]
MTKQHSQSSNKINCSGLKSITDHNNSVKSNSEFLNTFKNSFPQFFDTNGIFKRGKFDEELQENNVAESRDGYKLGFVGKDYARLQTGLKSETMIVPDIEHNSQPENKNSENVFITGDNIEALRHLQNAYAGKIKMIYIDPPYNTGKEFVYNDTFEFEDEKLKSALGYNDDEIKRLKLIQGKSSHSAWLTFMYPRLKLAQKLLSDDGVIFVSIDDNEQANLKLLMDEIFGEGNFITEFIRRTINSGKQDSTTASVYHESLLFYTKNVNNTDFNRREKTEEERKKLYPFEDEYLEERGRYYITQLNKSSIQYSDSLNYPITAPDGTQIWAGSGFNDKKWVFRWSKEKVKWGIANGYIVFKKNKDIWKIYTKSYEFRDNEDNIIIPSNPYTTLDYVTKEYSNFNATPELTNLFDGKKFFDFPKPVIFIKDLLKLASDKNSLILDFFAGSATTAHAVMQLNAEDGGNRKFIMVQIDEPTNENSEARKAGYKTIDEIARERIKRATKKIKSEKGLALSENFDGGFKHYRLVTPDVTTLDKIEKFDPAQSQQDLFNKMVTVFDDKTTGAKGEEVILQTWLIHDGYTFDQQPETIDFDGYQAYYIDQSLLYIICQGWGNKQT